MPGSPPDKKDVKRVAREAVAAHPYPLPGEQKMNRDEILAQVAAGDITTEDASKLLDELDRQRRGTLYCKVSQKGGLSLYGLQRMPVTLYVEQWERLLDFSVEIRKFIEAHNDELKRKTR